MCGVERDHGPQAAAIRHQQKRGGRTKGEAERKGEDGDLGVMGEQKGREDGQEVVGTAVVQHLAQGVGGRRRVAPLRHAAGYKSVEPVRIAPIEPDRDHGAQSE